MPWYAVQTYSGQENKVVNYIQEFIDSGDLDGLIYRVLCPTQDVVQIKKGKKVKTTKKYFPGYVLIEMELTKESMHFVRSVNGVMNFVGGKNPQPLKEDEVARILGTSDGKTGVEISELPFNVGDAVKIKEGPFNGFEGVVDEINPDKGKLRVMVSVFGRSTPVEVDFSQVDPIVV